MADNGIAEQLRSAFITTERPYQEGAVEVFEQVLDVDAASLVHAELAITALGMYDARIDGAPVGDAVMTPGYTYYPYDLPYQVYDVTDMLRATDAGDGADAVGAEGADGTGDPDAPAPVLRVSLAQGWYCGRFTCDNKTQIYGERPAASWVLTVEDARGSRTLTSRDADVHAVESPWDYAGIYDGEVYWGAGARPADVPAPEVFSPVPFTGALPEELAPASIRTTLHEVLEPVSVEGRDGVTIIDFGQNCAGVVEIDPRLIERPCEQDGHAERTGQAASAPRGIRLRHGEILTPDGSLYTANLRTAKAEVRYYPGEETEVWCPSFTYMGFRYVELTGAPWRDGLLRVRPVHTAMERTGYFSCGHRGVNRLYANLVWGQRSNYVEVPTDCPQRDERQGYTGDCHTFARTGAYTYNTDAFLRKFLRDIRMTQRDNTEGYVSPTVPAVGPAGIGFISMQGWGSADTILPELLYWQFGDTQAVADQYESMKRFVDCELARAGEVGLWLAPNLGDWLTLGRDVTWMAQHNGPVSNAFLVNDLRILVWAAKLLGHPDDVARYAAELERVRAAYLATFVQDDGRMTDDYQGAYIMALAHVVPRGELWDALFRRLVELLRAEGMQTGFFSTQHLLPLLVEGGEEKLAFDLLLQPECPGWMYEVDRGATTIWERWDALRPDGTVNEDKMSDDNMVSFNHYAFGSVGEFLYRYVLGIEPMAPGFARVKIAPHVDARLGHAEGSYRSRAGRIAVAWEVTGSRVGLTVEVPVAATVVLPDGTSRFVDAGAHELSCALGTTVSA